MTEWLYTDSSAMVKAYVPEPGSAEFIESAAGRRLIANTLTFVEVARVLAAAGGDVAAEPVEQWRADWVQHEVIALDQEIAEQAVSLAAYHGLRSLDAIHLASALTLRVPMRFATWDRKLWDAARAVGLRTVPAQRP